MKEPYYVYSTKLCVATHESVFSFAARCCSQPPPVIKDGANGYNQTLNGQTIYIGVNQEFTFYGNCSYNPDGGDIETIPG